LLIVLLDARVNALFDGIFDICKLELSMQYTIEFKPRALKDCKKISKMQLKNIFNLAPCTVNFAKEDSINF